MKKLLSILTLCMGLCCVSCYDDSALVERIDALEKNAIASINEQISAIKASITSLEAVDVELKSTIKALEAKDATLQGDIDGLKEADASLETKIGELKTYVDDEISNTEDWATATFATLEQYDSLCVVLTSIETSISELKEEFTKNLSDAISNSEESMKGWVNEQLTGYWTIAETQARLDTLKQTHNEDVEKLSTDLADAKEDMTEAYTTAISTAIEELDGKLSDEITKINDELTQRMDEIEDRLSAIEETLKNLTRDFSIAFDDYDIGILAGGTASVGYTIIGATDKTTVKALGQNGWSAKVTPDGTDKGKITVTAPNPLTEDEIIVLVYDGEYRTIMSSINFVTGVVTPSQPGVELEAEAGNIDIKVASNLNYKVSVSQDAMDWLSVVETKSIKESIVTLAYTANRGNLRQGYIYFTDSSGKLISSLLIMQAGISNIVIPVSSVNLNLYSVTLYVEYGAQLTASVMPKDATDKSVIWSSDAPNVAIVDERGLITAVAPGIANITATSGDVYATCSVTVLDIKVLNYIDEYGIDHGKGVVIGNAIWAPVNCGYHSDYYKYGKLYQWGRMYGQGYDKSDASSPIIEEGGVSVISGNDSNNANVFYTGIYNNDNSWVYPGSATYWKLRDNNDQPIKAEYDPCPAGWRIPSDDELYDLITNHSDISTDKNGHSGYWFSGPNVYSSYVPQIFLPLAGTRSCTGENMDRELMGVYWSTAYKSRVLYMLKSNYIRIEYDYYAGKWANGNSVRCVQE